MSVDITCDECSNSIRDGDRIYCEDDWNSLTSRISELEDTILEKDQEINSLQEEIRVIKDGEGFPG